MFSIRFAQKEDLPKIKYIAKTCNISDFTNYNKEIYMISSIDENVFGFISLKLENGQAIITKLVILPEYKDKGFENTMVRVILNHALDMGFNKAFVDLPQYEKFFSNIGFRKIDKGQEVSLKDFFLEK